MLRRMQIGSCRWLNVVGLQLPKFLVRSTVGRCLSVVLSASSSTGDVFQSCPRLASFISSLNRCFRIMLSRIFGRSHRNHSQRQGLRLYLTYHRNLCMMFQQSTRSLQPVSTSSHCLKTCVISCNFKIVEEEEDLCAAFPGELCAHICVPTSGGSYKCECRDGFQLLADGKSCQQTTQHDR